jgi:hypothetical protein
MGGAEIVGTLGVTLILIAFLLNLIGAWERTSRMYLALNLAGAVIACVSSIMISFVPFVVLEAVWAVAAFGGLVRPAAREARA